jgi:YARHG domain
MAAVRRALLAPRIRAVALLAFLPLIAPSAAAQSLAAWEGFDFAHRRVDSIEVEKLPLPALRSLRGIVFGRHGRPFTSEPDVQAYLKTRSWYRPDTTYSNKRLSAMERANLDIIRRAESKKHPQIETGDMRFYAERVITAKMLGHHTAADWQLLAAEIGALHGERFDSGEPDGEDAEGNDVWELQKYFDARYWYRGRKEYTPSELSAVERANSDTITLARMHDLGYGVGPGAMYLFQATPLTDSLLRGTTLYELRLLRNEVYARHGRRFETPWLRDNFKNAPWYKPRRDFTIAELSENEKNNVKLIQAVEARRHDELSTKDMSERDVAGLFPEVARRLRNEIFARHGRTFKDPTLQSYFASQEWYHPNPRFDPQSLTAIEKANVKTILAYEARAKQGIRFTEG